MAIPNLRKIAQASDPSLTRHLSTLARGRVVGVYDSTARRPGCNMAEYGEKPSLTS